MSCVPFFPATPPALGRLLWRRDPGIPRHAPERRQPFCRHARRHVGGRVSGRRLAAGSRRRPPPLGVSKTGRAAGALLKHSGPADQAHKIIATGFLALGPKGLNERDRRQFAMDVVDEQIDVVSQSMLGLTLACARCHDHKLDPVSPRDYYALAGIFLSCEPLYGTQPQLQNAHASTLIELPQEGLKVPAKQPKRRRLWLGDGSCIQLRPTTKRTGAIPWHVYPGDRHWFHSWGQVTPCRRLSVRLGPAVR
jgi:hypothetical protein